MHINTTDIYIDGMHCASCDILVKMKLKEAKHIVEVIPDFAHKQARIKHTGDLSLEDINRILCEYGYTARSLDEAKVKEPDRVGSFARSGNLQEILATAGIVAIVMYLASQLGLTTPTFATSATTLVGAFVIGLIASVSTCMATTGALFTSFVSHQHKQKVPLITIMFIVGRVISYGAFGYILGVFGSVFSQIIQVGSILNLLIALILIIAGLDMLHLLSIRRILARFPGGPLILALQEKQYASGRVGPVALLVGALTYLLPCGFTLSTQAYALSLGSPVQSALTMVAFALGTVPSLGLLSLLSRIRTRSLYRHVMQVVAILIIGAGLSYLHSTARLYGYSLDSLLDDAPASVQNLAPVVDGKQVVRMTATAGGYVPSQFTVRAGIPVRWEIEGKDIYSCAGTIQAPGAQVPLTNLKEGENILEFTPTQAGSITFSCSMGMFSGSFRVI